ncbi:MAG: T9SS type A sorting domain-containing protein [Crocinitomicaceae bacterium]|jgi:hypothetical protein
MKKLYIIPFLLFPFLLTAQTTINLDGSSEVISGGSHEVIVSSPESVDISFDIVNVGPTASWRVTRLQVDVPNGWTDNLCWGHSTDPFGGTCYSSGQMNGNPWTTPTSGSFSVANGEYGKLKVTIDPEDATYGQGHYRYYISYNGTLYIDSVDLVFEYSLGVEETEPIAVSIAPNPASEFIQVSMSGVQGAQMKMVDVLGNLVIQKSISSSEKIDISSFKSGIYIISFDIPGMKSIMRKVIVKH